MNPFSAFFKSVTAISWTTAYQTAVLLYLFSEISPLNKDFARIGLEYSNKKPVRQGADRIPNAQTDTPFLRKDANQHIL